MRVRLAGLCARAGVALAGVALAGGLRIGVARAAGPDPLAPYYGQTLVCLDAGGGDSCHIWLDPDGTFIRFGAGEAPQAGHFTATPAGAEGAIRVCLHADTQGVADVAGFSGAPGDAGMKPAPDGCHTLSAHDAGDRWLDRDEAAPDAGARRLMLAPGQR